MRKSKRRTASYEDPMRKFEEAFERNREEYYGSGFPTSPPAWRRVNLSKRSIEVMCRRGFP